MNLQSRLFKGADLLVTFAIYFLLSLAAHEMFHAQLARELGYGAVVKFPSWASGYVLINPFPINVLHIAIIGLVGGGLVALFYLLISIFTSDWETNLIMFYFVPWQALYAVMEVLYLLRYVPISILGTVPALVAVIPLTYKVWKDSKNIK